MNDDPRLAVQVHAIVGGTPKGYDVRPAYYGGSGFDDDLRAAARRNEATLIDVADLY